MNKLIEMEVFVQVVDAGSLAGAARRLRRNPSSVSKIIGALEDRLGIRLLTRTTRNMALTDAGEDFYEHCKSILIDIGEAEEAATALHKDPQGRLLIIGMNAFSPNIVLPLISGFVDRYPGVQIDLIQAEYFPDMVGADMDVALRIGEVTSKGLECVKLAPSHRLEELNCIGFSTLPQFDTWELNHGEHTEHIQPKGNLAASNAELIRQAALSGWGICQLSDFIVGPDIREGRLIALFPEQINIISNYICAIYPRKKRPPKKTLAFVEHLQDELSAAHLG